tara:strand:+ start:22553 stop:26257 length:3705 start_codon:yes stop_codon:yes gene_type:complete
MLLAGIASIRFYLIPNIDNHREWISQRLSDSAQQTVRLGAIEAHWRGLHPNLTFYDVDVSDKQGDSFFELDRLEVRVSTMALLWGDIDLLKIKLFSPSLAIKRDINNAIWISGKRLFPMSNIDDGSILKWLVRQNQVEILGGELTFTDERSNNYFMTFNDVLLVAKFTEDDTSIVLTSEAQNSWYEAITLSVETSNLLELTDGATFKGAVSWEVSALRMSPFVNWLPSSVEMNKSVLSSRGIANIDGTKSQSVAMDMRVSDFSLKRSEGISPLGVSQSSFQVSWNSSKDKQAITFSDVFALFDSGLSAHLDVIQVDRDLVSGRNQVVTRDLSLDLCKLLGSRVLVNPNYMALMERVLPGGVLNLIDISWNVGAGPFSMKDIALQARFDNVGLYASEKHPGIQGLTGAVKYGEDEFIVDIDSSDVTLDASVFFSQPLYFSQFKSMFTGTKISREWEINMTDVSFLNADLTGTAAARANVFKGLEEGTLDLQVKVNRIDLSRLPFYLPKKLQKTKKWLEKRVRSGTAENVLITATGEMSTSFFTRDGAHFEVDADVKQGGIEIGGGWPKVENISGRFSYKDHQIVFSPTDANIFGVDVSDSSLKIEKTGTPQAALTLSGMATATVADLVRYVNESPLNKATKGVFKNMVGEGFGKLDLSLRIPLSNRKNTQVNGVINLAGSSLNITDRAPEFKDFETLVEFNKRAMTIRAGQARIFDSQTTFASQPVERGLGRVEFESDVSAKAFMDYLRFPIELSGQIKSSGVLEFRPDELKMDLSLGLERLVAELPSPLDRLDGMTQPLKVGYVSKKSGLREITFSSSNSKVANFVFFNRNLVRGTINSANFVEDNVLLIGGKIPQLDVDGWRHFFDKRKKEGLSGFSPMTVLVDAQIDRVDVFGYAYDNVKVNGQFLKNDGLFSINSEKASGKIAFSGYGTDQAKLSAYMTRLAMARSGSRQQLVTKKGEVDLPLIAIDAVIDEFELDGFRRGAVTFQATPSNGRWDISELSTITDVGTLTMRGEWRPGLEPRAEYDVEFNVEDVGQYLFSVDGTEHMDGGVGRLIGSVSWQGSPFSLDLETLNGTLNLEVRDGRFLKINPGAGHIISLLSLQALPRRITLDFRDVFSSGFSFDYITSEVVVSDGTARTDKLLMDGTSASVAIAGTANLVKKEQDLEVFVTPKISGAASVAGAVAANPAVGLATYLAQKLLGNPFDRIATRHYRVKGNWSEPDVSRVQRGSRE